MALAGAIGGFASASMSGASFSEATHAGSVQVTQNNYVLTVVAAGVVKKGTGTSWHKNRIS